MTTLSALNWKKEVSLTFEFPTGEQWRLTVGAAGNFATIRYKVLLRDIFAWFNENYDADLLDAFGKTSKPKEGAAEIPEDERAAAVALLDRYFELYSAFTDWAAMICALRGFEQRPNADAEWQAVEIPDEWQRVETGLDAFPPDLLEIVMPVVNELNPGSLGAPGAKKKLTLIENSSTNGVSQSSTPTSTPGKRSKRSRS